LYEEAIPVLRGLGDELSLGMILQNVGIAAYQAGDLAAALRFTREASDIAERLGNKHGRAVGLDMTAQIELAMGNVAAAEVSSLEAVRLLRELGNTSQLSIGLSTLAGIRLRSGGDAAAAITEKLELDRRAGFVTEEAEGLTQLAELHELHGELSQALAVAADALDKARASTNMITIASALGVSAHIEMAAGSRDRAVALLEEQAAIWTELGHEVRAERARAALAEARSACDAPPAGPRKARPASRPT
jgi:ATP/maltotriose-dependent transcriptional regulator MalT